MTISRIAGSATAHAAEHAIHAPIVATVTPFRDNLVDTEVVRCYAEWLWDRGVKTILVNGTTGEFFAMTATERLTALASFRQWFPGTVIAHAGADSMTQTIRHLQDAQPQADYLAILAPYFYAAPPQDGVFEYFRQILACAQIPVLLYNFPHHTQTPITPTVLAQLAEQFPHLIGIKDSGSDRDITRAYTATGLQVFVGDDSVAAHVRHLGIDGIVTGGGNPIIEVPLQIAAAMGTGDTARVARMKAIFDHWNHTKRSSGLPEIAYIKAALSERIPNFPPDTRPPLITATPTEIADIQRYVRATWSEHWQA